MSEKAACRSAVIRKRSLVEFESFVLLWGKLDNKLHINSILPCWQYILLEHLHRLKYLLLPGCSQVLSLASPLTNHENFLSADWYCMFFPSFLFAVTGCYFNLFDRFSPAQLYEVVSDVAAYKEFVPWCTDSRILSRQENFMKAELAIGFKGIEERYISNVELQHPTLIKVSWWHCCYKCRYLLLF